MLLTAHPDGLVAGEIQAELGISSSNLSHHLDKLKNEGLIQVAREGTFLRYTANILYAECCTRNKAIEPSEIVQFRRRSLLQRAAVMDLREWTTK